MSAPASADLCARVCVTLIRAVPGDACEKRVILPDDVAGLGEAARHKEAFDDVDFLIHGLRQVGGEGKLRFRDEERGETECKKERLRSPASINSNTQDCRGKKKKRTNHQQ